jgi:hypothetical protein
MSKFCQNWYFREFCQTQNRFFLTEKPRRAWKPYIRNKRWQYKYIIKDPIRKILTHRSLIVVEKTSLKELTEQSGPPLLPPSSQRSGHPPSRMNAGTKPLAFDPTLNVVANLWKGLTKEVALPELVAGLRIGPRRTLDAEWLRPAVKVMLDKGSFQPPRCQTDDAERAAPPLPTEKRGLPSKPPHQPRAGGGRRRRRARWRNCSSAWETLAQTAHGTAPLPELNQRRPPPLLPSPPWQAKEEERAASRQSCRRHSRATRASTEKSSQLLSPPRRPARGYSAKTPRRRSA